MTGASIVMLDVPKGTEVGIDLCYWDCGPNFIGLKNIPVGTHFVYWSSTSQGTWKKSCLRVGKFLVVEAAASGSKIFWKWDRVEETFVDCCDEEIESVQCNWKDIVPRLGPVEGSAIDRRCWNSLTKYISQNIIDKICPNNRPVYSATQLISNEFTSSRSSASRSRGTTTHAANDANTDRAVGPFCSTLNEAEKLLPKMAQDEKARLCYSQNDKTFSSNCGLTATEITNSNLDHSTKLKTLLQKNYPDNNLYILGEVQFSFVCFLVGQNYDSFEHWKYLVSLICNSDSLLVEMPKLFEIFVIVLHFQLQQIPSDFFVDILSANNFLVSVLHVLFTNVEQSPPHEVNNDFKLRCCRFQKYLTSKFGWDFMTEPHDWCPTVVELSQ